MSCEYCENIGEHQGITSIAFFQRAADDYGEVEILTNYCPNCGEKLNRSDCLVCGGIGKIYHIRSCAEDDRTGWYQCWNCKGIGKE